MEADLATTEVLDRIRWVRMCMTLLVLQDDFRIAREIAATAPRNNARW